jgi:hypothetical protein
MPLVLTLTRGGAQVTKPFTGRHIEGGTQPVISAQR